MVNQKWWTKAQKERSKLGNPENIKNKNYTDSRKTWMRSIKHIESYGLVLAGRLCIVDEGRGEERETDAGDCEMKQATVIE